MFSASSEARDRNAPTNANQIRLQTFRIGQEHRPIRYQLPARLSFRQGQRRIARRFDLGSDLDSALNAVARGNSRKAIQSLAQIDHRLAARSGVGPDAIVGLRARGSIRVISETLVQNRVYFDGKPQRGL